MPRTTVSEPCDTEPGRAVVLYEAVFPLHHTLLPDRPLGDLHGERLTPVALPKARSFDGVPGTEEPIQRRLIAQDPNHNTSSPPHHATGEQDKTVQEPSKLHPNVGVSILLQVQHHGKPRFDVPGQRGHNHIGPSC